MGPARFRQFAKMMKGEQSLKGIYSVNTGSQTAQREAAMAELGLDPLKDATESMASLMGGNPLGAAGKTSAFWQKISTPEQVRDYMGKQYLLTGKESGLPAHLGRLDEKNRTCKITKSGSHRRSWRIRCRQPQQTAGIKIMAFSLSPWLKPRFFITGTNRPLAGGLLYSYMAGTTTPQNSYSDDSGTLNTNPIVLDADGQCNLYLADDLSYRFILKDAAGVTQFDKDNITGQASSRTQSVDTIYDLLSIAPTTTGTRVIVASYWGGWATSGTPSGGGVLSGRQQWQNHGTMAGLLSAQPCLGMVQRLDMRVFLEQPAEILNCQSE